MSTSGKASVVPQSGHEEEPEDGFLRQVSTTRRTHERLSICESLYGPPVHTTTCALRTNQSVKQPPLDPDSGWYTVRCGSMQQGISSVMREVVTRALAGAS